MTGCEHTSLHAHAEVFTVTSDDAKELEGAIVIRAMHVKVHCALCGMPFRFVGELRTPPKDPYDFLKGGAPWTSTEADELASWITPMEAQPFATMTPEGEA